MSFPHIKIRFLQEQESYCELGHGKLATRTVSGGGGHVVKGGGTLTTISLQSSSTEAGRWGRKRDLRLTRSRKRQAAVTSASTLLQKLTVYILIKSKIKDFLDLPSLSLNVSQNVYDLSHPILIIKNKTVTLYNLDRTSSRFRNNNKRNSLNNKNFRRLSSERPKRLNNTYIKTDYNRTHAKFLLQKRRSQQSKVFIQVIRLFK